MEKSQNLLVAHWKKFIGRGNKFYKSSQKGVFAKTGIKASTKLTRENTYFAFPYVEGQLTSGSWKENIIVEKNISKDGVICISDITILILIS